MLRFDGMHWLLDDGIVGYLFRYQSPKKFDGPDALAGPKLNNLKIKDSIIQKLGEDILTHGFFMKTIYLASGNAQ